MAEETRTVLKQLWVVMIEGGARYDAGSSYHIDFAQRDRMVQSAAERLSTDMQGELEEPAGDPVPIQVSEVSYDKIASSPVGVRVR